MGIRALPSLSDYWHRRRWNFINWIIILFQRFRSKVSHYSVRRVLRKADGIDWKKEPASYRKYQLIRNGRNYNDRSKSVNSTGFKEFWRLHLERTSRMTCEKATRRLKFLLGKAKKLGLNAEEVIELPATKRLLSTRLASVSTVWTTLAMIVLLLGGTVLAFLCAPCVVESRTWGSIVDNRWLSQDLPGDRLII